MSFRVRVDPKNPGEFFACCGLLELAHRMSYGAEGRFADGSFEVECEESLPSLLAILLMDPPEELTRLPNGVEVRPLIAPLRFSFDGGATHGITLDAWMTIRADRDQVVAVANPPWNFWSGQQTSMRIWSALREAFTRQLTTLDPDSMEDLFAHRLLLPGRFGFDPGAAWNALDVGFSPNEQGIEVASSPAVELLAAVGLQRFRPGTGQGRDSFLYATWGRMLAPEVARAAASGLIRCHPSTKYQGRVVSRGSYAALGYSTPIEGASE